METISRGLLQVSRRAQTCIGTIVKKYDLTIAEQPFFMAIRANDGLTQEELTLIVGVDKAMTTRVIRSLEDKGFVRKIQDEGDKRQNRIYKTEKIEKTESRVLSDLLQFNEAFTEGISESELKQFLETLKLLEENASKYLAREEC